LFTYGPTGVHNDNFLLHESQLASRKLRNSKTCIPHMFRTKKNERTFEAIVACVPGARASLGQTTSKVRTSSNGDPENTFGEHFWKFLECRGEAGHCRAFADDNN
jgi:hypothetical protein